MTIVVTGASGMIGEAIADSLKHESERVVALTRAPGNSLASFEARVLPDPDEPQSAFEAVLEGAEHVVHCAAVNSSSPRAGEAEYFRVNAGLTSRLARAASRVCSGRFVFLSSIRAVADGDQDATISDNTPETPASVYGRSKLAGERAAKELYAQAGRAGDCVALRLPPVYGMRMRGQLGFLLRLADTPLPLPLAGFGAPRSLVSVQSVAGAVLLLLRTGQPLPQTCIAADRQAIDVGGILEAFRAGLGRPRRLFSIPVQALETGAGLLGQGGRARQLAAGQLCDASALVSLGWHAEDDTARALALVAARIRNGASAGMS